jgi:hypothetical protein
LDDGLVLHQCAEGQQIFHSDSQKALVVYTKLDFDSIATRMSGRVEGGDAAGTIPVIQGKHLGLGASDTASHQAIAVEIDFRVVRIRSQFSDNQFNAGLVV